MNNNTFTYPHHIFAALRALGAVTYYTSPVDYIVVQYGGGWMPYKKFRKIKAFNHLPDVNLETMKERV